MFDKILSNLAMHIELDPIEETYVLSHLRKKTLQKNEIVLCAGEVCRNIYFVNRGCLRMYNVDEKGTEHNILFMPENWWAVDISSFSNQKPAFYNIDAIEDMQLLYLTFCDLEELYKKNSKLERFFRMLTQNAFDLYQKRITSSISLTAEYRYRDFIKQYPNLEVRIAQKHIASYLGITPVFLSSYAIDSKYIVD